MSPVSVLQCIFCRLICDSNSSLLPVLSKANPRKNENGVYGSVVLGYEVRGGEHEARGPLLELALAAQGLLRVDTHHLRFKLQRTLIYVVSRLYLKQALQGKIQNYRQYSSHQ
jgi:hypothetical protein